MLRDEAGGVIESIEIDDVPIYTFDDESKTTLPVDKKERKKWLKEKKSF